MTLDNFSQRILDILKADTNFAAEIAQFRLGDLGDNRDKEKNADSYPLCYVTTASTPEVERRALTPTGLDTLPVQKILYEFWVVLVVDGPIPDETQARLFELTDMALKILAKNIRLLDAEGNDPLCASADIFTQRRHEKYRGALVEAMTIRIRPTVIVDNS